MVHLGPTEPVEIPVTFTVMIRFSQRTITSREAVETANWIMDEMDPDDRDLRINFDQIIFRNIPTIDAANHVIDHVANSVITKPGFQFTVLRKE